MFKLIINPTLKCNFDCLLCHTKSEAAKYGDTILDVNALDDIFKNYDIKEVVISGGEPTLCPLEYMYSLVDKIREYYKGKIDFETNFNDVRYCEILKKAKDVNIVVSYNFHMSPNANQIWNSMYDCEFPFDIKVVASHFVVKSFHPNLILRKFSLLRNCKGFEVVRYWKNINNQFLVETALFEKFIKLFNSSAITCQAKFKNKEKILDNTYMYRPLIINPNGLLYVYKTSNIIETEPFNGEVPALDSDFQTYTSDLVSFFKG